jgi:hypothetical protein
MGTTSNLNGLISTLSTALSTFDWKEVDQLSDEIIHSVRESKVTAPPGPVKQLLTSLRRKRRFATMSRIAEALMYAGTDNSFVRRQYAQSLIDQGLLVSAEAVLQDGLSQAAGTNEEAEFKGLLGRIYKQWYVSASTVGIREQEALDRAIGWYKQVYLSDKTRNYWHGVNLVALIERGKRDGLNPDPSSDSKQISHSILTVLKAKEQECVDPLPAFDLATMLECQLSFGEECSQEELMQRAHEYVSHPQVDAFEIGSTLRQLQEVWCVDDEKPPGSSILTLLRARLLSCEGGTLGLESKMISTERARAAKLQLVYGFDGFKTLQWYIDGLDRCNSIGRIETLTGRGVGTGWLVRSGDVFSNGTDELLLMTNAHVISPSNNSQDRALSPDSAVLNIQTLSAKALLDSVVFHSPIDQLDCSVVRLRQPLDSKALVTGSPVKLTVPPPRLYVIGHPGGRDLEFSLHDNHLVGCDDRYIHYRTPTESGSSGSPVFNDQWQVVGLHHAGDTLLPRLDGTAGTYEANEGISIAALLGVMKKSTLSMRQTAADA